MKDYREAIGILAVLVWVTTGTVALAFNPWQMKITFSGYNEVETLTDFPVRVSLSTDIPGFSYDQFGSPADGADLRFLAADETTELNYAIGSWNTNGVSHVWVQVPELTSSNDFIYALWGNEIAAAPAYTTNGTTWGAGFQGVWHMQDATNVLDSSGNANHGTGSTGIGVAEGIAGNALSLNGSSHYVDCGSGGRIAVHYSQLAGMPSVRFSGRPERGQMHNAGFDPWGDYGAAMGSLYLSDANLMTETISQTFQYVSLVIPGFTSWSPSALLVNDAVFALPDDFELDVDQDLRLEGTNAILVVRGEAVVSCGRDLILTNGASLYLYAAPSNGTQAATLQVEVKRDLWIGSSLGGIISTLYPYASSTNGGVSRIAVTNHITLADGGAINADGRGYACGYGPGKGNGGSRGGGGGHGGRGGRGGYNTGGITNGSLTNPIGPGSGGAASFLHMGYGGGTVWLQAGGRVLVDGLISANGTGSEGGGGAGGAVNISGDAFGGSGIIRANGGDGAPSNYHGGAGGGGRIALRYQSLEGNPSVLLSTATERGNISIFENGGPQMGTLYLPDAQLIDGGRHENLRYTKVTVEGMTEWSPASLTITDAVFGLTTGTTINVAGSVMVQSTNAQLVLNEHSQLVCGGNLTLADGGALRVYAGATNAIPEDYGARVQVAGDTWIGSATADTSSLFLHSHEIDGGSALLALNGLTVATNGHINADRGGFGPGQGPGKGLGGDRGGGGGYGGQGCRGGYSLGGVTNGSAVLPDIPGSGGALFSAINTHYGHGGGLVRIEAAGPIVLDGLISANGTPASGSIAGGAGGGINILCGTFAGGAGSITANGLGGGTWGGGGGGGRIAVWQARIHERNVALAGNWSRVLEPDFSEVLTGDVLALAGEKGTSYTVSDPDELGQPGTIHLFRVHAPPGTMFLFR